MSKAPDRGCEDAKRKLKKLLVIGALASLLGPFPGAPGRASVTTNEQAVGVRASSLPGKSTHTVSEGETLWKLAVVHFPHLDPRCGVESIRRANRLEKADLQVGTVLVIPERAQCRPG